MPCFKPETLIEGPFVIINYSYIQFFDAANV